MSTASASTRAFVLRTVNYGESDRILTLLTERYGKLSAHARGARKSWRRFGGALEPFSLFEVHLTQRRQGLWSLGEATLLQANSGIAGDLNRLAAASFFLELTREISPEHDPQAALFCLLETALGLAENATRSALKKLVIAFQLRCLEMAGLGITADSCNACGRPVPPGRKVLFHPARGGVVCTSCGGGPIVLSKEAQSAMVELGRRTINDAVNLELAMPTLDELETAVSSFVDLHVDSPLKSRSLWNAS